MKPSIPRLHLVLLVLLVGLWGCGDGCSEFDQNELNCTDDSQCDDGLYCNGAETCRPDDPFASRYGCVAAQICQFRCDEEEVARCFEDGGDRASCCDAVCTLDRDCDDRVYCNGAEICSPRSPAADANGCVQAATAPCEGESGCDESNDICIPACEDADGDGYGAISCGGDDCDDTDNGISPGSAEICDSEDVDEDCDPTTYGFDRDGDGYADITCCNGDNCGTDCDDLQPAINPASTEVCNGVDDNCDGDVDETVRGTFYADNDGDGFGDRSETVVGCFDIIGSGYSPNPGDCDDTNPQISPGAIVCDPQPNAPTRYLYCETDGTYSVGGCDPLTEVCLTQPGGHGTCSRP